jgi:hypothetical protein
VRAPDDGELCDVLLLDAEAVAHAGHQRAGSVSKRKLYFGYTQHGRHIPSQTSLGQRRRLAQFRLFKFLKPRAGAPAKPLGLEHLAGL